MKKILIVLVLAGSVVALGAWLFNVPGTQGTQPPDSTAASKDDRNARSTASSTLPNPVASTTATSNTSAARAPLSSADALKRQLATEFDKATDLKALYDRYAASSDPAARYFAAKALMECAEALRQRGRATWLQDMRDARISTTDPKYAERMAAFDTLQRDRCSGFSADQLTSAAVSGALAEAARLGDPAARAAQLRTEIQQRMQAAMRDRKPTVLTQEDLTAVQDAMKSRDPEALRQIGEWGALWMRPEGLRVGPEQVAPSNSAWRAAWNMFACDSGANCGNDHRDIMMSCALDGACGAPTLQAHLQQFAMSPYYYQEAQRYQDMIRSALEQGRWDWLGLANPPTLGSRPPTPVPPRK